MKRKILASQGAAIVLALFTLTANGQQKTVIKKGSSKSSSIQEHGYLNVEADSIGDPVQRITTYRDGAVYKIKVMNEKITELFIDGKKIPEQDFPKYEAMVKQILEQVKRDQEQAEKDRAQAQLDRQQADKDRAQADKDRTQAEQDRQQADKDRMQADKDRQQADNSHEQAEADRQQAIKDRAQAEKDRAAAPLDRKQAERDRAQAEIDRKNAEEDRKMVAGLIADLKKEKVIESEADLYSLELTEKGLVVNDKKQSAELFQLLKAKYLKKPGARISFYNGGNTRHFSITQDN